MRYSRSNIVNQHLHFLQQHNITVTQDQRNIWSKLPVKFLAKQFAFERLQIAKQNNND